MKTLLTALLLIGSLHSGWAQGSLTPPGAPAPTMKTLDQVEPRVAITNLPIIITQGGSYYLTKSFVQNFSSDAISIYTNDVTLDLCGFTIRQTGSSIAAGFRIESPSGNIPLKNATVRNGSITGFTNVFGIVLLGPRNCVLEHLNVTECGIGISFQAFGTAGAVGNIVRDCRTCDNTGGSGVLFLSGAGNIGNVIEHCESLNNGTGFSLAGAGNLIIGCRASGNTGNNYTIATGNRMGLIVLPGTNPANINGSTGTTGTGTTDPFANLSY
jgi:hypothetical protein